MSNDVQHQEVRTQPLTVDQLRERVPEISTLLRSWGYERITVMYGSESNLLMDDLWRPMEIDTLALPAWIERTQREGIFRYGRSDLHIEDLQKTLEFLLCHESDIHFASTDQSRVQEVITLWRAKGFTLYVSPGPKGSASRKDWKRIGQHVP